MQNKLLSASILQVVLPWKVRHKESSNSANQNDTKAAFFPLVFNPFSAVCFYDVGWKITIYEYMNQAFLDMSPFSTAILLFKLVS